MKIASWNVNSLRVRLPQVLEWLSANPVDVLGIQETKLVDESFPSAEIESAGYQVAYYGQKTYNGVALLSRHAMKDVIRGMPGFEDEQRRVVAATVEGVRIINVYVPNGQSVSSDKYQYKLAWLEALTAHVAKEMKRHPMLAITGDFNIAPEDRDVHDPDAWQGQVLVSEPEREAFRALLSLELYDSFRLFEQPEKSFSWWDYRAAGFRRDFGLRIDHVLCSPSLKEHCIASIIDKEPRKKERPSDHTPVIAEFRN